MSPCSPDKSKDSGELSMIQNVNPLLLRRLHGQTKHSPGETFWGYSICVSSGFPSFSGLAAAQAITRGKHQGSLKVINANSRLSRDGPVVKPIDMLTFRPINTQYLLLHSYIIIQYLWVRKHPASFCCTLNTFKVSWLKTNWGHERKEGGPMAHPYFLPPSWLWSHPVSITALI